MVYTKGVGVINATTMIKEYLYHSLPVFIISHDCIF